VLCAGFLALAVSGERAAGQSALIPDKPTQAARLVDSCQSLLGHDDAKGAVAAARQAAALDPANREAPLCLGVALAALGEQAEAVPPLERVLAARPDNPDALFALANAYAALDDPRAERLFERLVALRPGDADVRLALVEYLWDHEQNQRANTEVERLLAEIHGRPDVRVTYAIDLLRQWQFERAARQLEQAETEGARTYQVAYLLGNAWWEAGETDRAAASFSSAIARDPSAAPARHGLGRLLLWMGRPEEAIPHLEKAAAAEASAATELDLGRSYEASGRFDAAETAYRKALALEPSLSPVYYAIGRLLKRMGKDDQAVEALGRYRELYEAEQRQRFYEASHRAELDYARQDLRRGDAAAALIKFERLGNTPDALIGRANALSRLNRHAEAVQVLDRARLLAPTDQRVAYLLARERAAKAVPKR
jgi:tetratricopeptide (TPR) repeat protein